MSKELTCGCGCGKTAHINRMRWVKIEELEDSLQRVRRRWLVLAECKEPFERELQCLVAAEMLVRANSNSLWRRLFNIRRLYLLQYSIHRRNKGEDRAKEHARRSAIAFGLPQAIGHKLAARWEHKALDSVTKVTEASQDEERPSPLSAM